MPSVEKVEIKCFPPWLDVPQLSQFIGRTASLELAQFRHAKVTFSDYFSQITLNHPQCEHRQLCFLFTGMQLLSDSNSDDDPYLDVLMSWMARVFSQLTALLSNVSHLSFDSKEPQLDLDNSKLLPLLYLFSTVEELHVFFFFGIH